MKIISALITVRFDDGDDDSDGFSELDAALSRIGFAGPMNSTCIPDCDNPDDISISYETSVRR